METNSSEVGNVVTDDGILRRSVKFFKASVEIDDAESPERLAAGVRTGDIVSAEEAKTRTVPGNLSGSMPGTGVEPVRPLRGSGF